MRLTLKLVDQRIKPSTYSSYSDPKSEDYDRAELDLTGPAAVVAGALRTLADDIAPPPQRPAADAEAIARAFRKAERPSGGGVDF